MKLSRLFAVAGAFLALAGASTAPASAQSLFLSPALGHAAGAHASLGSGYASPADDATPADDTGSTTPTDPSNGAYATIMGQVQSSAAGLLTSVVAPAFGLLILGLGIAVAWRLTRKGVKTIG